MKERGTERTGLEVTPSWTKTRSSGYSEEGAEAESLVKQTSARRLCGKQRAKL